LRIKAAALLKTSDIDCKCDAKRTRKNQARKVMGRREDLKRGKAKIPPYPGVLFDWPEPGRKDFFGPTKAGGQNRRGLIERS